MVAAFENLTRLTGLITARTPHPRLAGWDQLTVQVRESKPVPGKADLISGRRAGPVVVAVRHDLLAAGLAGAALPADAVEGALITARVRLAGGDVLAEPHPQEGDFVLGLPPGAGMAEGTPSGMPSGTP